jgi:type VI secretion system secreted protein Hcp
MADMFIRFDGVDGESQQKGMEKWIELSSFSMSSHTAGSTIVGGGSGVGKPSIDGVHFMTVAGRHTPAIAQKYFKGEHFPTVEVKFIKQTGADSAETYYHLKMQKVFVTSMQNGKGEGSLGSEQMSLTAEIYEQEYWAQNADGKLTSVGKTTYNEKTNVSS